MLTRITVKEIKEPERHAPWEPLGRVCQRDWWIRSSGTRFRAHGVDENIYDLPGHLEVARLYNGWRPKKLDLSEIDKLIDDLYPEATRVQQLVDGPIHPHLPRPSRKRSDSPSRTTKVGLR